MFRHLPIMIHDHWLYYHRASFANLTSFANFVAVASNLEIFPKVKL